MRQFDEFAPPQGGVRTRLQDATQDMQGRMDAAFAAFDLGEAGGYARALTAHARALPPLEAAVQRPWSGWTPRTPHLHADLAELGVAPPDQAAAMVWPLGEAGAWGVQYAMEASKLGERLQAARVGSGLPRRYLAAEGDWRAFQTELEAAAGDQAWLTEAISWARLAFGLFEAAALAELAPAD